MENPTFTALGAYIFAGGFTLGVRKHFRVLAHFEEGPFGVPTVMHNMPDLPVFVGEPDWPIQQVLAGGPVHFLYGNPPCAPWSTAGHKVTLGRDPLIDRNTGRYLSDERTKCTDRLFQLMIETQPQVFVWESVARAYTAGKDYVDDKTALAMSHGYSVTHLLFNGHDCGLPQPRKRFFFLAHRVKLPIERPTKPGMTVRQAWADLKDPGPAGRISKVHKDLLEQNPSPVGGGKLKEMWERSDYAKNCKITAQGYHLTRPGFLHARVHLDKPSPTVTGGQHLYHPTEPRHLGVKEQQVLCGYPQDYQFVGKVSVSYAEIARAVLPPVADWLAGNVRRALEANIPEAEPRLYSVNFLGGVYGKVTD